MLDLIGGPGRDRTGDLFHAIAPIKCTFNNLQAAGDCQTTRKYAEGPHLTGDFAGEKWTRPAQQTFTDRLPKRTTAQTSSYVVGYGFKGATPFPATQTSFG